MKLRIVTVSRKTRALGCKHQGRSNAEICNDRIRRDDPTNLRSFNDDDDNLHDDNAFLMVFSFFVSFLFLYFFRFLVRVSC
jgi:hypothetical protein